MANIVCVRINVTTRDNATLKYFDSVYYYQTIKQARAMLDHLIETNYSVNFTTEAYIHAMYADENGLLEVIEDAAMWYSADTREWYRM